MGESKRIKYIDSLRGVCCIIVFAMHLLMMTKYGAYASGCGKIAVWFFMLSAGFFLLYPYVITGNTISYSSQDILNYYKKRIIRIFPPYLLTIILMIALKIISFESAIDLLGMKTGVLHLWFTVVIIKFYIMAPLFLGMFRICTQHKAIYAGILAMIGCYCTIRYPFTTYEENSTSIVWYAGVFIVGILMSLGYNLFIDKIIMLGDNIRSSISRILIITGVVLIIIATPFFRHVVMGYEFSPYLQNKYFYITCCWVIIWTGMAMNLQGSQENVWGGRRVEIGELLCFISKYSYEVYLFHFIYLLFLSKYLDSNSILYILGVIGMTIVSISIWTHFDRFLNRFLRRVSPVLCVLFIAILILGCRYGHRIIKFVNDIPTIHTSVNHASTEWRDRLYVPTMINKIGDTYFIIDCWNHRVLYSQVCSSNISDWNTLIEDNYCGGHSIASDGELLVLDNTDMQQLLVYKRLSTGVYKQTQIIKNVNTRPHFVLYNKNLKSFFVVGSLNGTIYSYQNNDGQLEEINHTTLDEIKDSYVRSINIIDGKLYTVSGPSRIFEYVIEKNDKSISYRLSNEYIVPDSMSGMNEIVYDEKSDGYIITVNTGVRGIEDTTIVWCKQLGDLKHNRCIDLYSEFGLTGQPYFITYFDDKYFLTEISEDCGNGIFYFSLDKEGRLNNVETLFSWDDVLDESRHRYQSQEESLCTTVVDLFLFMGQSNMSGKGEFEKAPSVNVGWEFRSITDPTTLHLMTEPFGVNENNPGGIDDTTENGENRKFGGMVSAFANSYYSLYKVPIVGVSASEEVTRIEQWDPEKELFLDAASRLEKAREYLEENRHYSLRYTFVVWCQGESDGDVGTTKEEYYIRLKNISDEMVDNLGVNQFFVIEIGNRADNLRLYEEIQKAQEKLCLESNNCTLISRKFLDLYESGLMKDIYHYYQEGYNIVGTDAGANAAEYANGIAQ